MEKQNSESCYFKKRSPLVERLELVERNPYKLNDIVSEVSKTNLGKFYLL